MLAYLAGNVGSAWSYVDPAWGYVGLSWRLCGPILRPMSADLEAYVGPCWPAWSQKIRKMGTAKKHCKTQDILRVGGLSWSYVGPSWGYVGPSWSYVGPSWGLCWPILGLCWPILGLCWPILGLCWPILRPMLAHLEPYVGPCWPILNHKIRKIGKKGRAKYPVKRRIFWRAKVSPAGGAAPFSYGEERTAVRQCHGQGAPGRTKGLPPLPPTPKSWAVCLIRQSSKTAPNCVPKPCSNLPTKSA